MKNIFDIKNITELLELNIVKASSFDTFSNLNDDEIHNFKNFVKHISGAYDNNECKILYRADRKSLIKNIFEKTNTNNSVDLLFYVGNKAKTYFQNQQDELDNRDYLKHISDKSLDTFKWIFDTFNKLFVEKRFNGCDLRDVIDNFLKTNIDFGKYFLASKNRATFTKGALASKNQEEIRDYYLYILHTISSDLLTFFISSTDSLDVAKSFCNSTSRDNLVFLFWLPRPIDHYAFSQPAAKRYNKEINKLGFPTYADNFYPQEHEVSVKGAIFPHFIVGYYDLERSCFIANPHSFTKKLVRQTVSKGFYINQTRFDSLVSKTDYGRYVLRYFNRTYTDQ